MSTSSDGASNQNRPSTIVSNMKICRVCGDRALGHNFNVVTCESCKAFFRRNALRNQTFQCPFNDNCDMTPVSRKFCQKCRLKKCYEVGMKKDAILTDEKLDAKRRQYRKKKQSNKDQSDVKQKASRSESRCSNASGSLLTSPSPTTVPNVQLGVADTIDNVYNNDQPTINPTTLRQCSCECSCGAYPPGLKFAQILENALSSMQHTGSSAAWTPPSINTSLDAPDLMPSPNTDYGAVDFNETSAGHQTVNNNEAQTPPMSLTVADREAISELKTASVVCSEPLDRSNYVAGSSLTDVICMIDMAIRRLIEMSKRLRAFGVLCQDDQIALLKGGCTEMMILRGAMTFQPDQAAWKPNETQPICIKMDVLKRFNSSVYEEHKKFLCTFDARWRTNETVMLLMTAMTLFNPAHARIQHPQIVTQQHERYAMVLKRYLNTLCTPDEASRAFDNLRIKLAELHRLNENAVNFFSDVDPKEIGPLLIEIFDLRLRTTQ